MQRLSLEKSASRKTLYDLPLTFEEKAELTYIISKEFVSDSLELNTYLKSLAPLSDDELEQVTDLFIKAASLALSSGEVELDIDYFPISTLREAQDLIDGFEKIYNYCTGLKYYQNAKNSLFQQSEYLVQGTWSCENCTLCNSLELTLCDACGIPKTLQGEEQQKSLHQQLLPQILEKQQLPRPRPLLAAAPAPTRSKSTPSKKCDEESCEDEGVAQTTMKFDMKNQKYMCQFCFEEMGKFAGMIKTATNSGVDYLKIGNKCREKLEKAKRVEGSLEEMPMENISLNCSSKEGN